MRKFNTENQQISNDFPKSWIPFESNKKKKNNGSKTVKIPPTYNLKFSKLKKNIHYIYHIIFMYAVSTKFLNYDNDIVSSRHAEKSETKQIKCKNWKIKNRKSI